MALEEEKRENLLRDAVAYHRRLALQMPILVDPVSMERSRTAVGNMELFAGVRADGSWSLYFDEDPVIQFTSSGELRRLFIDNRKFRCVDDKLWELTRDRRGGRVELNQTAVPAEIELVLREQCLQGIRHAWEQISQGHFTLIGRVPSDDVELLDDLRLFLAKRLDTNR